MTLLLRAVDVVDQHTWRWVLTGPDSATPIADHQVALDPTARGARAFADLPRYLRRRAGRDPSPYPAPADPAHEAYLLEQVAAWLGLRVLGEKVGQQIVAAAPVTVRVQVPATADFLLHRPLELAYAEGMPLARRGDISLVYESLPYEVGAAPRPVRPVGDRLRVLALFGRPTADTPAGLRRERFALTRLIRQLATARGRAVDLEVLQYGVTRERLRERMTAGGGPDILHLAGQSPTGELQLERPDGGPVRVPPDQLLTLLAPAAGRLKLAVVSNGEPAVERGADEASPATGSGFGPRLARELGCAVVAMRYPVTDDFSIAFDKSLYGALLGQDLPLEEAFPQAVTAAAGRLPSRFRPAISFVSPVWFGTGATPALAPPTGDPATDPATVRLAQFPPEPVRLAGRADVLAGAGAALAPGSDRAAVLLHGPAGTGKTTCALELAYQHLDQFPGGLCYWRAPARAGDGGGALVALAQALERQLAYYRFRMVDKTGTVAQLRAALPGLSQLLTEHRLLLVLDNVETLLTADGAWCDQRWAELMAALLGHEGRTRTVLTSRVRPADLPGRARVVAVPALTRDESAQLARELPHLRGLPSGHESTDVDAGRPTLAEVLRLAAGNPTLLELADAAAAEPARLAAQLAAVRTEQREHPDPLTAWTVAILDQLPEPPRLLCQLLCLSEEADRRSDVVAGSWADLWHRLDRPGDPPDPAPALTRLTAAGLVRPLPGDGDLTSYQIHRGVAEVVRAATPAATRIAADATLAARPAAAGTGSGIDGGVDGRGGLAAVPYLIRLQSWEAAADLLQAAAAADRTGETVHTALSQLRRIVDAAGSPHVIEAYATVLAMVDPGEAERATREIRDRAVAAGDLRTAAAAGGALANLLRGTGPTTTALAVVDLAWEHARAAGLGPWTQLSYRAQRLQFTYQLGHLERVLAEVDEIRAELAGLPDPSGPDDTVDQWQVREMAFGTGFRAARDLGRWEAALDLNTEVLDSKRGRDAGAYEVAVALFNSFGPLLELGRLDEADGLLHTCHLVFDNHQDPASAGRVLSARAMVAGRRGDLPGAVALGRAALGLAYLRPEPGEVAQYHSHHADDLTRATAAPAPSAGPGAPVGPLAHRLAASLIFQLSGQRRSAEESVRRLARELAALGQDAWLPRSVADLTRQVEQVPGVRFGALIGTLAQEPATAASALTGLLRAARNLPAS